MNLKEEKELNCTLHILNIVQFWAKKSRSTLHAPDPAPFPEKKHGENIGTLFFSPHLAFVLVLSDQHEEGEESASRSCRLLGGFLRLALNPRQWARFWPLGHGGEAATKSLRGLGGGTSCIKGKAPFPAVESAEGGCPSVLVVDKNEKSV